MPGKRIVRTVLVALGAGLLGGVVAPPAGAWSATLQYTCSGDGFGAPATSYTFAAALDTDVPATLPYGSQRSTAWATTSSCRSPFRSWAVSQGYTTAARRRVPRHGTRRRGAAADVPVGTRRRGPDHSADVDLGRHVDVDGLGVRVGSPRLHRHRPDGHGGLPTDGGTLLATSATCVLDPTTPTADTVVDAYDVVAATTTTALAVKGDTATATVTSNGTPPVGIVTFSVGGRSVAMNVVAGKATAKLPAVPPGDYGVSAQFVPSQPTQLTSSTGTASYTVKPIATKTRAFAVYRPARDLLKARARVTAPDGSDVSGRLTFVLKRNGTTLDNVTVRLSGEGVAVKKFRGITKAGRYVVVAKYLGTATYERSKDRTRLTLP